MLATDLLGFREATWGTGFAVTTGIATARRGGQWGLGLGASLVVTSVDTAVFGRALRDLRSSLASR